MPIDLYKYSNNFENALINRYFLTVGRKNRLLSISMRLYQGEFVHISGLEHLETVSDKVGKSIKKKELFFKELLSGKFTYNNFKSEDLIKLTEPKSKTYNYNTNCEYTLEDRFNEFDDIDIILKNAYKGQFYKWSNNKEIILPNNKTRKSTIGADYVLVLPSNNHKDERLYLFLVDEDKKFFSKNKKSTTLNLKLISAFADCKELLNGQEKPYTILNYEIEDKNHNITNIFTHEGYKKSLSNGIGSNIQNISKIEYSLDGGIGIISKANVLTIPNFDMLKLIDSFKKSINKISQKISSIFKKENGETQSKEQQEPQGNLSWNDFNKTDKPLDENINKNPYKVKSCTPINKKVDRSHMEQSSKHNKKVDIKNKATKL